MEESQTYLIFVRGLDFKSGLGTFVGVVLGTKSALSLI